MLDAEAMRLALLLLVPTLAACPQTDGPMFVDHAPRGLTFRGPASVLDSTGTLGTTTVGGQQDVAILDGRDGTIYGLPYTAVGGSAVAVDHQTYAHVTLDGRAPGENTLTVLDDLENDTLLGSTIVDAAPLAHIRRAAESFDRYSTRFDDLAFSPATTSIGFEPVADTEQPLVDTSMTLVADGATQYEWDALQFDRPPSGTTEVTIHAGGKLQPSIALVFADHADAIVLDDPAGPIFAGEGNEVCFGAFTGDRVIVGLTDWTEATDNGEVEQVPWDLSCVWLTPAAPGTANLHVTAAGASLDVAIEVLPSTAPAPAPMRVPARTPVDPQPTAGERASM